ncbi:tetratricopeptide repeat protein [Vibrio europaeus]|uniref:Secretion protein n=1 Tax=Vibrio europaeus TaxID=300876 RepID=A0A178JCY2_9VIBR|nr:tetratricopeptide repeat protein [Vibrio europaeus]MDC5707542.1 tetratricopeptide repeat protein [Vibrio europaeus]MDC5709788.1 tetratricopeptide repeat protein [Vibrio europaeus]MDC5716735.1 tetratricopeptide repeat protein [Vibrio europaeus]MDC5722644.1 tetratricopeptide repeat protein [Vibrio europaeus]MDC5727055.1 tetratricopeptide repeat protein [Vibrio europaeus]
MYKLMLLAALLLSGCATTQTSDPSSVINANKEQMYVEANNQEKLIEFYKQELRDQESTGTRIKLARTYLAIEDPESAIFAISQLDEKSKGFDAYLILAKAHFQLGDIEPSVENVSAALSLNPKSGEAYNLAGVLAAVEGKFEQAEQNFIEARKLFYSDDAVKNNLATLYLIQGHYKRSYDLLLSVYQANPKDAKTEANLVIALVKLGDLDQAQKMLGEKYDHKQTQQIINSIRVGDFSNANFES